MGLEAPWHWVILAIIVIALFGYKKLPDAARSLGRSLRIFKTEIKGMTEDDATRAANKAEIVPPATPAAPAQPETPTSTPTAAPPAADAEQPATASAKNDNPAANA
jgi:sec-independent protein translocase protein TatA